MRTQKRLLDIHHTNIFEDVKDGLLDVSNTVTALMTSTYFIRNLGVRDQLVNDEKNCV